MRTDRKKTIQATTVQLRLGWAFGRIVQAPLMGVLGCLVLGGCASSGIPSPDPTLRAYAEAVRRGDSKAIYGLLSEKSQQTLGREGVEKAVTDAKEELAEQAAAAMSPAARMDATARLKYGDGEEASLEFEDGVFRVGSADALPAGAKTPAQALEQLRKVLARRSYAGLMRVLSKETRRAMEDDLRSLVEGLERPDGLDVKVTGDRAVVQVSGGHQVKLKRENGIWRIEDFD